MQRMLILLVAALAWAAPIGPTDGAETQFGQYRALVFGINDYQHLPRLETAERNPRSAAPAVRVRLAPHAQSAAL